MVVRAGCVDRTSLNFGRTRGDYRFLTILFHNLDVYIENVVPHFLTAVKFRGGVGEICGSTNEGSSVTELPDCI